MIIKVEERRRLLKTEFGIFKIYNKVSILDYAFFQS